MCTSAFVQKHISSLSKMSLFTTRELLQYGSRNAVDLTLHKLVKKGWIFRIARGVFRKTPPWKSPPSLMEVAKVKAKAFGRKIYSYGDVAAYEMGMSKERPSQDNYIETGKAIFYTDGSKTSFQFQEVEVEFKSASPRKRNLVNDRVGKYLKALWHLGPMGFEQGQFLALGFDRIEKRALKVQLSQMPDWIKRLFPRWHAKYRDYDLWGAPVSISGESLFDRIQRIIKSGRGKSITFM